jgi:hypothetical protein
MNAIVHNECAGGRIALYDSRHACIEIEANREPRTA